MPKTTADLMKLAKRIGDLADEIYEALEEAEYEDDEEGVMNAYLYTDSLCYNSNELRDALRSAV